MWQGINCRETIKLPPTKANLQYADRLRSEILRRIELGTFNYAEYFPNSERAFIHRARVQTFQEAADKWLLSISGQAGLAASTIATYRKNLNKHWMPVLGPMLLNKITFSDLTATLGSMQVAAKSRNNIIIPMRQVLETAFIDGVIEVNPASRLRNIKVQKPEPDPFSLEEIGLILNHLKKYDAQVLNYFEVAFFTGLRTSEMIEIKWGDLQGDQLTVRRAKVEGVIKGTKTSQVRIIELNDRAINALQRQKQHSFLKGDYIFLNPVTGMAWNDQRAQSRLYWTPTLKALGLRDRVPYQCRHTYATLTLMAGANPMWVSRQLGHATMKMTLEVYSRWIDLADKSREVDKVNQALFSTDLAQTIKKAP